MPSLNKHCVNLSQLRVLYGEVGHELRFVGGCVRDTLLGITPYDIDLAATMPALEALSLLKKEGVTCIPTGIDHGTITVVVHEIPYQITTLRRDISTDGRRATIHYTDSWQEDAARRDFTINALYRGFDHQIYDYFNGLQDLKHGVIRFIGNAEERILEDYLRILRLFRFYARYGKQVIATDTLRLCEKYADKLKNLSAERITREILDLLDLDKCMSSLEIMDQHRILDSIFKSYHIKRLQRTLGREYKYSLKHDPIRRLASLTSDFHALSLSKKQHHELKILQQLEGHTLESIRQEYQYLCVAFGKKYIIDRLIIYFEEDDETFIHSLINLHIPYFPLRGQDFIDLGLQPGVVISQTLDHCLRWWCKNDFLPSREECLAYGKNYLLC